MTQRHPNTHLTMAYGAPPAPGWEMPPMDPQPFVPFDPARFVVQPPPPTALESELAAIKVIVDLDDVVRARVLRYLVSRFGPVTP